MTPAFRIQTRRFSSNIIEKRIEKTGKITWIPYVVPVVKKEEGDLICKNLLKVIFTLDQPENSNGCDCGQMSCPTCC